MLTKIILDGPMGKKFGREWNLAVNSPAEALRMIDANKPGVFAWIRDNLDKYEGYQVICKYEDDSEEYLNNDTFELERELKEIRFVPTVVGAGGGKGVGALQIVLGVVLIIAAIWTGGLAAGAIPGVLAGVGMIASGIVTMLTTMPKPGDMSDTERRDGTSYYFDGPTNTSMEGVPVPLIAGRCLIGSHPIYVNLTVDDKVKGS
ncbi:MAG: tail assembly protein [Methylomicrobium sp.]|nr:tail assembly protein [Methylomicrobium sp.]